MQQFGKLLPLSLFGYCKWRRSPAKQTSSDFFAVPRCVQNTGKLRFGRYLRNAGSMGWVFPWRGYVTQRIFSVQKHLPLHYGHCASSKYFSGQCIWDWYFSLTCSAMKQVPTSYLAPPFVLFLSQVPYSEHFSLPDQDLWVLAEEPSTSDRLVFVRNQKKPEHCCRSN
jgi:hypothetical protein